MFALTRRLTGFALAGCLMFGGLAGTAQAGWHYHYHYHWSHHHHWHWHR